MPGAEDAVTAFEADGYTRAGGYAVTVPPRSTRVGTMLLARAADRYAVVTEDDRWNDADESVPLRVVSIPKSEVEQMLIGSNPEMGGC